MMLRAGLDTDCRAATHGTSLIATPMQKPWTNSTLIYAISRPLGLGAAQVGGCRVSFHAAAARFVYRQTPIRATQTGL